MTFNLISGEALLSRYSAEEAGSDFVIPFYLVSDVSQFAL